MMRERLHWIEVCPYRRAPPFVSVFQKTGPEPGLADTENEYVEFTEQLLVVSKVAFAMLLGGLLGLERELLNKPAGLRTHMLVTGGAALLIGLSRALAWGSDSTVDSTMISLDPTRIVQAVVTGISFLGAGTIIRESGSTRIEGLTTAASILLASAIGMTVALEQFVLAVGVTALTLLVVVGLGFVEHRTGLNRTNEY